MRNKIGINEISYNSKIMLLYPNKEMYLEQTNLEN